MHQMCQMRKMLWVKRYVKRKRGSKMTRLRLLSVIQFTATAKLTLSSSSEIIPDLTS